MNASRILSAFGQLNLLVVGDICLDRWCQYDPATAEASRETGIPKEALIEALRLSIERLDHRKAAR